MRGPSTEKLGEGVELTWTPDRNVEKERRAMNQRGVWGTILGKQSRSGRQTNLKGWVVSLIEAREIVVQNKAKPKSGPGNYM